MLIQSTPHVDSVISVVIIGRNEGVRLKNCIATTLAMTVQVVYVDSASTDDSVLWTRGQGIEVFELDMTLPFTAARARNAGYKLLIEKYPGTMFVQFLDGDCELSLDWLKTAVEFLSRNPAAAVVCGRLRERFPDASIYNRLCDLEWDRPAGQIDACGGIALIRSASFAESGGFNETLIAGEEQELCARLNARGQLIYRVEAEMALHDAAIMSFSQWWKRTTRTGYGYGQAWELAPAVRLPHQRRRAFSAWIWGGAVPALAAIAGLVAGTVGLAVLSVYLFQWVRILLATQHDDFRFRLLQSTFLLVGKIPECVGQIKFWSGRTPRLASKDFQYK